MDNPAELVLGRCMGIFRGYWSPPLPLEGKELSFQEERVLARGLQRSRRQSSEAGLVGSRPRRFLKEVIQGMLGKPPFLTAQNFTDLKPLSSSVLASLPILNNEKMIYI